jgi:hypothetical protein
MGQMRHLWMDNAEYIIEELIKEHVLDRSPDGFSFKITDFGKELFEATRRKDEEWNKPGIIKVATFTKNEILIRAGEEFVAQRTIHEIFEKASSSIDIEDPYIGPELFDRISDSGIAVPIRVLGSKWGASLSYCEAFKKTYRDVELRKYSGTDLHDRFVFVDRKMGYHFGHSIKDLGEPRHADIQDSGRGTSFSVV